MPRRQPPPPPDPPFIQKSYEEIAEILASRGVCVHPDTVREIEQSALRKIRACYEASRAAEARRNLFRSIPLPYCATTIAA